MQVGGININPELRVRFHTGPCQGIAPGKRIASMKTKQFLIATTTLSLMTAAANSAPHRTIYLDKLDKELDKWWNALDEACS